MIKDIKNLYDVVVVGGGPAGLTAALYLARARYRVLVLEKESFGGQIKITSEVVNYPGIEKIDGHSLTEMMRKQAQSFGAEFLLAEALSLDTDGDIKVVHTSKGDLETFGILLATGAFPRMIGFKGEAEYKGRGVAYCATCDGEFFTGKEVFVIGGGYAAAEESVFLTRYASHVTMLVREPDFTCDASTAEHAKKHKDITIHTDTEVVEASGDEFLRKLVYKNNITGEITEYNAPEGDTFGIFVFAGYQPQNALVKDKAELVRGGYIWTDATKQTSIPGVYACGDVCDKPLRQVVTATGDGALAATELEKYAASMHAKTGLKPIPAKGVDRVQPHIQEEKKEVQADGTLFGADIVAQLNTVFAKMESELVLELCLDDRVVSKELEAYVKEMAGLTDKIDIVYNTQLDAARPCVRILHKDGRYTGLAFHGVPGGHEFTSFILGLYNAAGPGQAIDEDTKGKITAIEKEIDIKILVSLSCTMCPELVLSAQRIASLNENVKAEVYDINHFGDLKEQYKVMSVPCMVINDSKVVFGKKNIDNILELIG